MQFTKRIYDRFLFFQIRSYYLLTYFQAISKAKSETEILLWKRLKNDLEEINVAQLPYNHPLCSGILDAESKPIFDMPESLRNIFEHEIKKKYTLPDNDVITQTCKDFFQKVKPFKNIFP